MENDFACLSHLHLLIHFGNYTKNIFNIVYSQTMNKLTNYATIQFFFQDLKCTRELQ